MKRYLLISMLVFVGCLFNAFAQLGGNALKFDGTDDYVEIPHNDVLNVTAVTMEMWFYWDNETVANDVDFLIGKGTENLEIHTGGGSGNHALRFIPTTGVYIDTDENVFESKKWNHVAFVYDPAQSLYICYINGSSVHVNLRGGSPVTTPIITTPTEALKLGMRQGGIMPWEGKLDEVRIWNDVRTEAEIKANMNKELLGNEAGLVAYYKLNENAGTTVDDATINNLDGTFISSPVWQSSGCFASTRKCLDFDGINDYVLLGSNAKLNYSGASTFTFETWVNVPNGNVAIFTKKFGANSQAQFNLLINGSMKLVLNMDVFNGCGWQNVLTSDVTVPLNQWAHVAMVKSASIVSVFVNGELAGTGTLDACHSNAIAATGLTTLGLAQTAGYFKGKMDEVRFWNTARTETQIRENMMKALVGNEVGLDAYYRMDEGSGTAVYDLTSNVINGTMMNMDAATDWVSSDAFNTWIGGESTDWANTANWGLCFAPTASHNVGLYKWNLGNECTISGSPTVYNILLSATATPVLSSDFTVNGSLLVEKNTNINGQLIILGIDGNLVEGNGNFYGTSGVITTARSITTVLSGKNIAGLGAIISTNAILGNTMISRGYGNTFTQDGKNFIYRYYDITPSVNTNLNASLTFKYSSDDLNGLDENALKLYSSTNGGMNWIYKAGTIYPNDNYLTANGLNSLSLYSLSPTDPQQATNITFTNITRTGMTVKWNRGSGNSSILLASQQYRMNASPLTNGVTYSGNTDYSVANAVSGAKVLYNGDASEPQVNVSGLTKYKLYYFKVVEYTGGIGAQVYDQSENATNPRSRWTLRKEDEGVDGEMSFNLYPNPAKDNLNYTIPLSENSSVVSEVYSSDGRLVKSINHGNYSEGEHTFNLNVNDMPNGVYLLRINTGANELVGIFEVIR